MPTIPEALALALQHHQAGRLQEAEQIYRQILQAEPNHAEALHFLGAIAHQVGRHELAVEYMARAITLKGNAAHFHSNLAKVYHALGRAPEAIGCARRALELSPDLAEAHNNLALLLKDQGDWEAAIACSRRALELQPHFAEAQNNLGLVFVHQRKLDEAISCFRRALALKPGFLEAHNNLGIALKERGELTEAVACYLRVLELQPDLAEAHNNLGNAYRDQGKLDEAIACGRRALELQPHLAEAHNNLGLAFSRQRQPDAALACFRRALELKPRFAAAHHNLGLALMDERKLEEAIPCFRRALDLDPNFAEVHNDLGLALMDQRKLKAAIDSIRRALELKPEFAKAHNNLGLALMDQAKLTEAVASFRRALELQPDLPEALINLPPTLFLLGRHAEAWPLYESRLTVFPPRNFSAPRWHQEPAEGQTILLHCEQGFGDSLQFMRYASLVREYTKASRLILECQPKLARLFAQSVDGKIEIIARTAENNEARAELDWHLPLLSAPFALGVFEPLPMSRPYLRADPALRAVWRDRLGLVARFRVGLAWQGNPAQGRDRFRSIPPELLLPLLKTDAAAFYSLQMEQGGDAPALVHAGLIDLTAQISDFADTAALIAELDLIIAVDTAVVHLAGALGRPVWNLLTFVPHWPWGLEGKTTPWYPTMRLFRQSREGDWDSVLRRIAVELGLVTPGRSHPATTVLPETRE